VPRWVRIGLGISAAWIASAAIAVAYADIRVARFLRYAAFELCDYVNRYVCRCGNCWRELMDVAAVVDEPLINFSLMALAPSAVAWGVAWFARRR
jgi:CO dehydrogenase/acetyl-CoA synthase alpha subunit